MDWHKLETFSFGDSSKLADELLALVLEGKKRATCWAVSEGLKGAALAKPMVALDGAGRPRAILETVELVQRRFDEVDASFAFDEGEGDRSLAYWREVHRRYFTRLNLFRPDMMLWCERFNLISTIALQQPLG
ncbi:MAG: ASCH domain-containing protein [Hyphomicrobiales bacterium]|nr:ASCH domain-containing protein [Hyphomicrobiales bacterium]MBV9740057.1 ASCH domain-containing protein [Hyphomicrobiales bacterium]